MPVFCTKCGAQNEDFAQTCSQCQTPLPATGSYQPIQPPTPAYGDAPVQDWKQLGAEKKMVAGICGILLGGFGVHKFILGYTTEGIIQIVITCVTCGIGGVVGVIEGIIYLTKSDEEFVRTYIQNKRGWF
jgi:TM2 domain-containing membrane protein YozV